MPAESISNRLAFYSKKYKSLDEIEDGATVIMSSSVADHGRVLALFEANGLIKFREGIDKVTATFGRYCGESEEPAIQL